MNEMTATEVILPPPYTAVVIGKPEYKPVTRYDRPPPYQPIGVSPGQDSIETGFIVTTQNEKRDHHLCVSVFLTVFCCITGGWISLLCSIPAIVYSFRAQAADAKHDSVGMSRNRTKSFWCNIGALVGGIITLLSFIGGSCVLVNKYYLN